MAYSDDGPCGNCSSNCGACEVASSLEAMYTAIDNFVAVEIPEREIPQNLDPALLGAPSSLGTCKAVLRANGGKLINHYNSPKWEHPDWNRSTQRSWKKHRRNQYK